MITTGGLGFAIGVLATWRVTYLLHAEVGPWRILSRLRAALARRGLEAPVLCFFCMSVWTAAPLAAGLAPSWRDALVWWPALSAGAIALHRVIDRGAGPPAIYYEPEGVDDELLRPIPESTSRSQPDLDPPS